MSLIVLINAYNEERTISKAISSVHDFVDEIHVFDGAYDPYPYDVPYSTDRTKEICLSFPKVTFHQNEEAFKSQIEKRSSMFIGKPGDTYLRLDGDEYITNPEELAPLMKRDFGVAWIWTHSNLYKQPYKTARIVRHVNGIHHAGRHHWLFDGSGKFITSDQNMNMFFKPTDSKIRMYNQRNARSIKRKTDKLEFVKRRNVDEFKFKNELDVYKKHCQLTPHFDAAQKPVPPLSFLKVADNPKYTMTLMFSREWMVQKYFDNLKKVWIPPQTELLVLIDSKSHYFKRIIERRLNENLNRFDGIGYTLTGNDPIGEFENANMRRARIVEHWNRLLTEANGEIILGSEDDSLPEPMAYAKLLPYLETYDFAQADIIGRWGAALHPAWKVEEKDGEPFRVYCLDQQTGTSEIDGCGWYCFVASTDTMRSVPMHLDGILPLGPDLRFGYQLKRSGKKLVHVWDVRVQHHLKDKVIVIGETPSETRAWIKRQNTWVFDKRSPMRRKTKPETQV